MRLLIVDDEKIVLDSICLIIKKEGITFAETMTASTGSEAVETAMRFHPDVVFMDINMPGVNGVEAMKSILAIAPYTLFVLITAYDVFDYAKESLQYGAYDYIVKPFTPKRIVDVLTSLNEKIARRDAKQNETIQLKSRLASLESLANDGIISMMTGGGTSGLLKCHSQVFKADGGRIALLGADEAHSARVRSVLIDFSKESGLITGSFTNGQSILYMPSGFDADSLCARIRKSIGDAFTLAVGKEADSPDELWISYRQAVSAFKSEQNGCIRYYTGETDGSRPADVGALYTCDESELTDALTSALSPMLASGDIDSAKGLIAASLSLAAQPYIQKSTEDATESLSAAFCDILLQNTPSCLTGAAMEYVRLVRSLGSCGKKQKQAKPIIAYIESNYASDISPDTAARELNMSVATLARTLRDAFGKSFTELLTNTRISEAERLLMRGELSVKEICFAVGYNDPNYFSRVFRRETGYVPTEYRRGFEGDAK